MLHENPVYGQLMVAASAYCHFAWKLPALVLACTKSKAGKAKQAHLETKPVGQSGAEMSLRDPS